MSSILKFDPLFSTLNMTLTILLYIFKNWYLFFISIPRSKSWRDFVQNKIVITIFCNKIQIYDL